MSELVEKVGKQFRTFGGGQLGFNNPVAAALKDGPYRFAAGVDVANVVAFILSESKLGYDWAIKRAQDLAKENVDLVTALETAKVIFKLIAEDHCRPRKMRSNTHDKCMDGFERIDTILKSVKLTESTPSPVKPQ